MQINILNYFRKVSLKHHIKKPQNKIRLLGKSSSTIQIKSNALNNSTYGKTFSPTLFKRSQLVTKDGKNYTLINKPFNEGGDKYSPNIIKELDSLKKGYTNRSQFLGESKGFNENRTSPLGFKSYAVPRIENVLHNSGIRNESSPTFKMQNLKINRITRNTFNNVDQEYEKMKNVLNEMERNEMSNHFPKIATIFNQNKIRNISIPCINSKIMGEKYNPMNSYYDNLASATRRNQYGALFNH